MAQLIDGYPQHPGSCRLCRSSAHTPVVDTDQDIDLDGYEGRLYICVACATELGDMVGMLDAKRAENLRKENSKLRKRVETLKDEFIAAREFVVEAFTLDETEEDAA